MILAALLAITVEVGPAEPKCVQRAAESLRDDLAAVCPGHTNDTRRIIIRTVGPDVLGGPRGPESSIRTYSDGVWTITGADPRGTVYGIYQVSEELGVSPFYWWDDIPKGRAAGDVSPYQAPVGSDVLGGPLSTNTVTILPPKVRYRGLFVNDEELLAAWSKKTKTDYMPHLLEMMLRCRLNTLWPGMHGCSPEFFRETKWIRMAADYGIVLGSSHCEPMMRNNVHWNAKKNGSWNYRENKARIDAYWKEAVARYRDNEVLWTIGMRGIHDHPIEGAKTVADKVAIMQDCFATQTNLIAQSGPPRTSAPTTPMLFVPYKEVLQVYNAGLKVPEEATIMWANDNYGYMRRLPSPGIEGPDRKGGVYWHVSYCGTPRSYLQVCSTPPGFMQYELLKCYENNAREVWMLNVGDVKPADILIYAFGRLAWDPEAAGSDFQSRVLSDWLTLLVGGAPLRTPPRQALLAHMNAYYRLAWARRAEFMDTRWAAGMSAANRAAVLKSWTDLRQEDETLEAALPPELREAWFESFGYAVRYTALAAEAHLAEGGGGFSPARQKKIKSELKALQQRFDALANGKWRGFTRPLQGDGKLNWKNPKTKCWWNPMQWPWSDVRGPADRDPMTTNGDWGIGIGDWIPASEAQVTAANAGNWEIIEGLGITGRARALLPVKPGVGEGAKMTFDLAAGCRGRQPLPGPGRLLIRFLPDYRLYPGQQLRVKVSVDGGAPRIVAVPGAMQDEDEVSGERVPLVLDGAAVAELPLDAMPKSVTITALDPGVVVDAIGIRP